MVTAQPFPSIAKLAKRGRSSFRRMTCPSACETDTPRINPFAEPRTAAKSMLASLSKTSQTTSVRRNTAAGVGDANGKKIRTASSLRLISTLTDLSCSFVEGVVAGFAFVMVVGVIVGTYSSVFVACPFALLWEQVFSREARVQRTSQKGDSKNASRL